jgi:ParB family chromosome partitioning protein
MSDLKELTGGLVDTPSDMTPEAMASDASMKVQLYDVNKIYADPNFNCRGDITATSVVDLAKSIREDGLQEPIVIMPRRKDTPIGFDYVVVAGHRRHKAYLVNRQDKIPAILRDNLSEFQARTLNAVENLQRQNLNMLQEANAIRAYVDAGWGRQDIAKVLKLTDGWVQVRTMILRLPPEIQEAIGSGYFTQSQVRELYGIKDLDKQMQAAKRIKEAKQRGEAIKAEIKLSQERRPNQKKIRKKPEIFLMQEDIARMLGNGLATRCLAWAAGQIDDIDLHNTIREECDKRGVPYECPDHLKRFMDD